MWVLAPVQERAARWSGLSERSRIAWLVQLIVDCHSDADGLMALLLASRTTGTLPVRTAARNRPGSEGFINPDWM